MGITYLCVCRRRVCSCLLRTHDTHTHTCCCIPVLPTCVLRCFLFTCMYEYRIFYCLYAAYFYTIYCKQIFSNVYGSQSNHMYYIIIAVNLNILSEIRLPKENNDSFDTILSKYGIHYHTRSIAVFVHWRMLQFIITNKRFVS